VGPVAGGDGVGVVVAPAAPASAAGEVPGAGGSS
jgi:hypothetical protein